MWIKIGFQKHQKPPFNKKVLVKIQRNSGLIEEVELIAVKDDRMGLGYYWKHPGKYGGCPNATMLEFKEENKQLELF